VAKEYACKLLAMQNARTVNLMSRHLNPKGNTLTTAPQRFPTSVTPALENKPSFPSELKIEESSSLTLFCYQRVSTLQITNWISLISFKNIDDFMYIS
jgi:hypothetical protein